MKIDVQEAKTIVSVIVEKGNSIYFFNKHTTKLIQKKDSTLTTVFNNFSLSMASANTSHQIVTMMAEIIR